MRLNVIGLAIIALLVTTLAAVAQPCNPNSMPSFVSGGNVFGYYGPQWQQFFGAKADINNGTLCNTTITNPVFTGQVVLPGGQLGSMAYQQSNAVNITGASQITGLPSPLNPTDAATKQYVDSASIGLIVHTPVNLATAAALPANTYNNGTAGIGATLTANANGALTVDSVAVSSGNRILVTQEAAGANNGAYTVTATGDGSDPYILTRATDFNSTTNIQHQSYFFVTSGSTNAGSGWLLTNTGAIVVGTTPLALTQFSSATQYMAGAGLFLGGSTFSIPALGVVPTMIQTGSSLANTTAMRAAATTSFPNGVWRVTDGAVGAPPVWYNVGASACVTDDGASCIDSSNGKSWVAQFPATGADVREFGAASGGSVDAEPAIAACLAVAPKCLLPGISITGQSLVYRLAETLVVPDGRELDGEGFTAGNLPIGATLTCDLSITPCIIKGHVSAPGGPTPRNSATMRDLIQSRAGGTIPSGSIGIRESYEQDPILNDIYATNDDVCLEYLSNTSSGNGLQAHADHIWTGNCTTTHVEVNGWPVVIMHDVKLGFGAGAEDASTNYFLVTGGPVGDVNAGPSALVVNQFMVFSSGVTQNFVTIANCANCAGVSGIYGHPGAGLFQFSDGHVENVCHVITTDSTATDVLRFTFTNSSAFGGTAGCSSSDFFNLNPATGIDNWDISHNYMIIQGTISGLSQYAHGLVIADNGLNISQWSITLPVGSELSAGGNTLSCNGILCGNFQIQGGPYIHPPTGAPMKSATITGTDGYGQIALATTGAEVVIADTGSNQVATYVLSPNGSAVLGAAASAGLWVAATCVPASGKLSVGFNCNSDNTFDIVNNSGSSKIFDWAFTGVATDVLN